MTLQTIHTNGYNPVVKLVNRAADTVAAYVATGTAPHNVQAETEATARCLLIRGTLESFIRFCYVNSDGVFVNLSGNYQIPTGVYVPFGSGGKQRKASGRARLTHTERFVVRRWLLSQYRKGNSPVFTYDPNARRWCVNTVRYPTVDSALAWLQAHPLSPQSFLAIKGKIN